MAQGSRSGTDRSGEVADEIRSLAELMRSTPDKKVIEVTVKDNFDETQKRGKALDKTLKQVGKTADSFADKDIFGAERIQERVDQLRKYLQSDTEKLLGGKKLTSAGVGKYIQRYSEYKQLLRKGDKEPESIFTSTRDNIINTTLRGGFENFAEYVLLDQKKAEQVITEIVNGTLNSRGKRNADDIIKTVENGFKKEEKTQNEQAKAEITARYQSRIDDIKNEAKELQQTVTGIFSTDVDQNGDLDYFDQELEKIQQIEEKTSQLQSELREIRGELYPQERTIRGQVNTQADTLSGTQQLVAARKDELLKAKKAVQDRAEEEARISRENAEARANGIKQLVENNPDYEAYGKPEWLDEAMQEAREAEDDASKISEIYKRVAQKIAEAKQEALDQQELIRTRQEKRNQLDDFFEELAGGDYKKKRQYQKDYAEYYNKLLNPEYSIDEAKLAIKDKVGLLSEKASPGSPTTSQYTPSDNPLDDYVDDMESSVDEYEEVVNRYKEVSTDEMKVLLDRKKASKESTISFDDFWDVDSDSTPKQIAEQIEEEKRNMDSALEMATYYNNKLAKGETTHKDWRDREVNYSDDLDSEIEDYIKAAQKVEFLQNALKDSAKSFAPGDNWGADEIQTLVSLLQLLSSEVDKISDSFNNIKSPDEFQVLITSIEAVSERLNELSASFHSAFDSFDDNGELVSISDHFDRLINTINELAQASDKLKASGLDGAEKDIKDDVARINEEKEKIDDVSSVWNADNVQQLISMLDNLNTEITNISTSFGKIDADAGIEPLISQFQTLLSVVNQVSDAMAKIKSSVGSDIKNRIPTNSDLFAAALSGDGGAAKSKVTEAVNRARTKVEENYEKAYDLIMQNFGALGVDLPFLIAAYQSDVGKEVYVDPDELIKDFSKRSIQKEDNFDQRIKRYQDFIRMTQEVMPYLMPSDENIQGALDNADNFKKELDEMKITHKEEQKPLEKELRAARRGTDEDLKKRLENQLNQLKKQHEAQENEIQGYIDYNENYVKASSFLPEYLSGKKGRPTLDLKTATNLVYRETGLVKDTRKKARTQEAEKETDPKEIRSAQQLYEALDESISSLKQTLSDGLFSKGDENVSFLQQLNNQMQEFAENIKQITETLHQAFDFSEGESLAQKLGLDNISQIFSELKDSITTFQSTISSIDFSSLREGANAIKTEGESAKEAIPYKEEFAKVNKEKVAESGKETAEKIEEAADAIDDEREAGKSAKANPEDVIYHAGVVSRLNKAETNGKFYGSNRGTGYFGTGHYFVDAATKHELMDNRNYSKLPFTSVDISKYDNLFDARNNNELAGKLHDFLHNLTRYTQEDERYNVSELFEQFEGVFGKSVLSMSDFETRLLNLRNYMQSSDMRDRNDSVSTKFMKSLGYGGVDTRGTRYADTRYGTVIYDLKEESILQANITDELEKQGDMLEKRSYAAGEVWDKAEDDRIQNLLDEQKKRAEIQEEFKKLYNTDKGQKAEDDFNAAQNRLQEIDGIIAQCTDSIENAEEELKSFYSDFGDFFDEDIMPIDEDLFNREVEGKRQGYRERIKELQGERSAIEATIPALKERYETEQNLAGEAWKQAERNVEERYKPKESPISPVAVPDDKRLTFGKDIRSIEGYADANQDFVNQLIADVATGQKEYDVAMNEFKSHVTQRQEELVAERERNTRVNGEILKFTEGAKPVLDAMGMAEGELPDGYGAFLDQITKESIKGEEAVRKFAESVGYSFDKISNAWKKKPQDDFDELDALFDDNYQPEQLDDNGAPVARQMEEIRINEQALEQETIRVAQTIRDEFGVKSTQVFGKLKEEVKNLLTGIAKGEKPKYDNLFGILARDSNVISDYGKFDLYDQIKQRIASSHIRISDGDQAEFPDNEWKMLQGTLGFGVLSKTEGSDALSFLEELREEYGQIPDTIYSTQDALHWFYDFLSHPPNAKEEFLSDRGSYSDLLDELFNPSAGKIVQKVTPEVEVDPEPIRKATKAITDEGEAAEVSEIKKKKFEEANRKVAESGEKTADATKEAKKGIENEGKAAEKNSDAISEVSQPDTPQDNRPRNNDIYTRQSDSNDGNYSYTKYLGYGQRETTRATQDAEGNTFEVSTVTTDFRKLEDQVIKTDKKILNLNNDLQNAIKKGSTTEAIQEQLDLYGGISGRLQRELDTYYRDAGYRPDSAQVQDFYERRKEAGKIAVAEIDERNNKQAVKDQEKLNKSIENTDALIARQRGNLDNLKAKYVDNAGVKFAKADSDAITAQYDKIVEDYFDKYRGQVMPKSVKEEMGAAINEYKRLAQQGIKNQKANTQFNPYSIQAGKDKLTTDINNLRRKMQKSGADTSGPHSLESELDSLSEKLSSDDLKSKDLEELTNQLRSIQQRFKDRDAEYTELQEKVKAKAMAKAQEEWQYQAAREAEYKMGRERYLAQGKAQQDAFDKNVKNQYKDAIQSIREYGDAVSELNKLKADQESGKYVSNDQMALAMEREKEATDNLIQSVTTLNNLREQGFITEQQYTAADKMADMAQKKIVDSEAKLEGAQQKAQADDNKKRNKTISDFYKEQIDKFKELLNARTKMNELEAKAESNPEIKQTQEWTEAVSKLTTAYQEAADAKRELEAIKDDITDEQYQEGIKAWEVAQNGSAQSQDKKTAAVNKKNKDEYEEQINIIKRAIEARDTYNKMLADEAKGQVIPDNVKSSIVRMMEDTAEAADEAIEKIYEFKEASKITDEQADSALDKWVTSREGSQKSRDDLDRAVASHDVRLAKEWEANESKYVGEQTGKIQRYYDAAKRASNAQDLFNLGEISANQLQQAMRTMEKYREEAEKAYETLNKLNQRDVEAVPNSVLDNYRQEMADVDVLKSSMSAFNDNENYEFKNVERGYQTLIKYAERYAQIKEKQSNGQMLDYSEQAFLNRYGSFYEDAINKASLFVTAQGEASDALKQLRQQFDDTMNEAQTSAFNDNLEEMGETLQKLGKGNWNEDGVRVLRDLNDEFENLVKTSMEYEKASPDKRNQIQDQIRSFGGRLNEAVQRAGGGYYSPADEKDAATLKRRMEEWMYKNSAATEYFPQIQNLQAAIDGASAGNLDEIAAAFERIKTQATEAGDVGKSFGETLKGSFKGMARYLLTYADLYEVINIAKQGVNIVRELDTALTEMRKVSDEPLSVLKDFAQHGSFEAADRVGTTSKQIQESTADWLRLGESFEQAQKSAELSTVLLNVSEFQDINAATESLTAMSQAYKDLDKSEIIDKLNYVGNNYAISTSELAESLQKSAGTLQVTGDSFDEAVALTTAANAVLQDPLTVGQSLKTISLRLSGTSVEDMQEAGEEIDGLITTQSKLRQTILDATKVQSNGYKGFDILNDDGTYKTTYERMLGIAEVFKEIGEEDKKFGTNRQSLLLETVANGLPQYIEIYIKNISNCR